MLARKWRPHYFDSMVGQDAVVAALRHALDENRLHHAYLFTGTRGVGKTTLSRILAKCLNCTGEDGKGGVTSHPCGKCDACRAIDEGRFPDYIEIDAASNRSVEEITPLLDRAVYAPTQGRYKVYMIDEVHMLQCDVEDFGRAARAREIHSRDDGSAEGADDGSVALPAVQSEKHDACGGGRSHAGYPSKGRD